MNSATTVVTVNETQTVDLPSDTTPENEVTAGEITNTYDPAPTTTTTTPGADVGAGEAEPGASSGSTSGDLPFTGSTARALILVGAVCLGAGVALLAESRRRKPREVD